MTKMRIQTPWVQTPYREVNYSKTLTKRFYKAPDISTNSGGAYSWYCDFLERGGSACWDPAKRELILTYKTENAGEMNAYVLCRIGGVKIADIVFCILRDAAEIQYDIKTLTSGV